MVRGAEDGVVRADGASSPAVPYKLRGGGGNGRALTRLAWARHPLPQTARERV